MVGGGREGVQLKHQVRGTLKTRPQRVQDESEGHTDEVVLLRHQVHGTLKTRPQHVRDERDVPGEVGHGHEVLLDGSQGPYEDGVGLLSVSLDLQLFAVK